MLAHTQAGLRHGVGRRPLAKLHMFIKPARCASLAVLGEALDKWEAMDDDFKWLALREPVPKRFADLMTAQVSLRAYPVALMFVRRQVAEHRHDNQVKEIQRQARAPHGSVYGDRRAPEPMRRWQRRACDRARGQRGAGDRRHDHSCTQGKGKGKSKGPKAETRDCYNCGKKGHLARNCTAP